MAPLPHRLDSTAVVAAVLREPGTPFVLEPLTLSALGDDEVLVKIAGTGLCHTDLQFAQIPFFVPGPRILGHEGAGVVAAVGCAVTDLAVGDYVVLSYNSCGTCAACRTGRPYHCVDFGPANDAVGSEHTATLCDAAGTRVHSNYFGQSSFATHAVATTRNSVRIDDDLPLDIMGALGCGLLTGAGAVLKALALRPGMTIAVFGAGAVGLSAVMTAAICGARRIVAVDLHPQRLELARALGATDTFLGDDPDLAASIRAAVGALDRTFDTTGVAPVVATAVDVLAPGGVCGLVGIGGPLTLDPMSLVLGRTVTGIVEGNAVAHELIPQLIAWYREGRFPFDRLITRFPLADIAAAIEATTSGAVVKPVLVPPAPAPAASV